MLWRKRNQYLLMAFFVTSFVISIPVHASQVASYEYARVLDVQPVVEVVQVPRDQQICQQEMVRRRVPEYRSPAPAIFGSILGGVIGSQFGGGSGRTVATIAGASIGGAVATHAQHRRYPPRYYNTTEQRCHTETSWSSEERVVAWDVSWKYRGTVYHSRMDEPPGDRIPVRVSVEPVYD
jgi:uncharacterized protein YcfJ